MMIVYSRSHNAATVTVHQISHDTLTITLSKDDKQVSKSEYRQDKAVYPRWIDHFDNVCAIAGYLVMMEGHIFSADELAKWKAAKEVYDNV